MLDVIISEGILFWMRGRKPGAGKQQRAPHQDCFLRVFIWKSKACLWSVSARALLRSRRWNISCGRGLITAFVCSIQCPWTSLACVLIKSLLVIPRGARWDSSHVISPCSVFGSFPRFLSSSTCPLNFPQSPARHQSPDEELSFLFSRLKSWSTRADVRLTQARQLGLILPHH